jgi:ribonuclease-3
VTEPLPALAEVEDLLGYKFSDPSLLFLALCHRSYVNEKGLPYIESNERLEFLGDSVVELAVTHVLYEDFPDYPEGELTKMRSPLVRGKALAEVSLQLGLDDYVLLGKGEEMTGGRQKQSILADTYEAVVGALYLDGGFDVARGFVISCLEQLMHEIVKWGPGDFKSELQELSTKRLGVMPRYRIKDEGPDHFKTFHATVEVGERSYGPVAGTSKKEAEQGAARSALIKLGWRQQVDRESYKPGVRAGDRPGGDKGGAGGGGPRRADTAPRAQTVAGQGRRGDGGDTPGARRWWHKIVPGRRPRG